MQKSSYDVRQTFPDHHYDAVSKWINVCLYIGIYTDIHLFMYLFMNHYAHYDVKEYKSKS